MRKPNHYTVWVKARRDDSGNIIPKEERIWEVSEAGCGPKTAERIAREVKADFDCITMIRPDGAEILGY